MLRMIHVDPWAPVHLQLAAASEYRSIHPCKSTGEQSDQGLASLESFGALLCQQPWAYVNDSQVGMVVGMSVKPGVGRSESRESCQLHPVPRNFRVE
jgi:hypothetical protein